jgi:hypothetical protein
MKLQKHTHPPTHTHTARDLNMHFQHGKGKFVYRSGNVYDGAWCNDVPHGKGIFIEGNVIYDIEHENGTVGFLSLARAHTHTTTCTNIPSI